MSFGIFGLHIAKNRPAVAAASPTVTTPKAEPTVTQTNAAPTDLTPIFTTAAAPPANAAAAIPVPAVTPQATTPAPTVIQEPSVSTSATPVTAATTTAPVKTENAFERFIDKIGSFFVHEAPVVEAVAQAAEPFLALTPFGAEYDLVVNAIVSVQQTATASLATGATLTNDQKFALVVQAVTPGVTAILKSKGITTSLTTIIATFVQNVFNILAGPSTSVPPTAATTTQA